MRHLCRLLVLCLTASFGVSAAAQDYASSLPALRTLTQQGAEVSAMVVDLERQQVLAAIEPDRRLTPASVSKLYATAAALDRWGPDSRFTTRFSSTGSLRNGSLDGDLIFIGAGDPDFDFERMWLLIARLKQAGVSRVRGDIVVNDSLFGQVICLSADRCQARSFSDSAYDAPLSAAGINFSTVELSILPADRAGAPADIQLLPPGLAGFRIAGQVATASPTASAIYSVLRSTEYGDNKLEVDGRVPVGGGPFRVQRSVAYPSRYTASVVAQMLADSGITVEGDVRVESTLPPTSIRTLAEVDSPALALQLRRMMTFSNNYMADTLTLDLAAYDEVQRPLNLSQAGRLLEEFAVNANAYGYSFSTPQSDANSPLVLESGSGLTVTNKLAARDVISLLAYMHAESSTFPAFLGSLPVPLHTPSSSLKRGNVEWLTRIAGKTGTLSEPVSVRALAGYFRLKDGGWGAFAMIVNGSQRKTRIPFSKSNAAIISDMQRILAVH